MEFGNNGTNINRVECRGASGDPDAGDIDSTNINRVECRGYCWFDRFKIRGVLI